MKTESKIIVITGAESTGKSALCEWLANHFQVPFVPEFARIYVEKLNRHYNYSDLEIIARKQIQQLSELKKEKLPLVFADTWLIITQIWFEEVFDRVPDWLESAIRKNPIDLFLVCDTDLPWEPDPVRENGGEKRLYLQNRYIETIKKYGFRYKIVRGKNEERFQDALQHLESL
ncbi:ATPase [Mariniphaga sediminis]|uniref:ATPase n=1 Tax=Mariniphaga sediminis TaxID=1628158 RepID=A0A399CSJ6_9BACT|nr:ATP-binding protein [Mariniphaga sediminis]RIH63015.1 ATPase [Mariniphaga sediminis]